MRSSLALFSLAGIFLLALSLVSPDAVGAEAIALDPSCPLDVLTEDTPANSTADSDEKKSDEKWDVNDTHGPHKEIAFRTSEGTWMSVDVSPDGKTLLLDMLGDLYTIPIGGGEATRILGDRSWDYQPRWSPDGSEILFTSDRGGTDNLWICKADGSEPKAFTEEKDKVTNCGAWSADGDYIVAKRRLTDSSSIGASELWLYHRIGGNGLQITKKDAIPEVSEPIFDREGRFLYFSARPARFRYDRDVNDGIYQIRRYDRLTGDITVITSRFGGAGRPTLSPDGTLLAYITRDRLETCLVVHDLATGAERVISDGLTRDLQESFAWAGVYPAMSFTPDGKRIALSAKGKLWTVGVADADWKEIPFTAQVTKVVEDALRFKPDVTGEKLRLRILRWIHPSPQDGSLVFSAIGRLYTANADGSNPRPLIKNDDDSSFEYAPCFSPDGKWIAYVSWSDAEKGHVWKARANGSGAKRLTNIPGQYANPDWSSDGKQLVYLRGSGATLRGNDIGEELWHEIHIMDANGGEPSYVSSVPSRGSARRMPSPQFGPKNERIYFNQDDGETDMHFVSVARNGTDRRHHATIPYGEEATLSPDGKWLAYKHLHDGYLTAMPFAGKEAVSLTDSDGALKVKKLSKEGADWLNWSDDNTLTWSSGPTLYRQTVDKAFADPPKEEDDEGGEQEEAGEKAEVSGDDNGADDEKEPDPNAPEEFEIVLELPRHKPSGTLVIDGARLITMRGDEVIENGRIVIMDNRIAAIGAVSAVSIPEGAKLIDAKGLTAMPGMVDAHAHMGYNALDIFPQRDWQYYANLAYGVTATMDPSASTQLVFGQSEMVEAGVMKGPRVYSTGFILYGADIPGKAPTNSLEDAQHHIRRLKKLGAFAVKSYMQPRREQRQWYVKAAREEEMLVFPEGGGNFEHNIGMVVDGHTGVEHAIPVAPLYDDIIQLWGQTEVGYTPTLLVAYGGISGENFFYQNYGPVWKNEKLLRFTPRSVIDSRSRRLPVMAYEGDWHHINVAASANKLMKAGGSVQIGAHGQRQGLGAHWELWSLGLGGMSNHDALRAATYQGAWYIGLGDELGSLEKGKLADIVLMRRNPLDDLQNTDSIRYVVKNGELFDGDTMDELYPKSVKREAFLWEGTGEQVGRTRN